MATVEVSRPTITRRPKTAGSSYLGFEAHRRQNQMSKMEPRPNGDSNDENTNNESSSLSNRPKTAPASTDNNIVRDLEKQNSNFRSARYLALQWRSRSAQWSATSSMRSVETSSTVYSSPPPPLKEYDSDSDSSVDNHSVDESVVSQVSEAYKVLDAWKSRSASLSLENQTSFGSASGDDEDFVSNRDTKDSSMNSKEGESIVDEFGMVDSFSFAFATKIQSDTLHSESSRSLRENKVDEICRNPRTGGALDLSTTGQHAHEPKANLQETHVESSGIRNGNSSGHEDPLAINGKQNVGVMQYVDDSLNPPRPSTYKELLKNRLQPAKTPSIPKQLVSNHQENKKTAVPVVPPTPTQQINHQQTNHLASNPNSKAKNTHAPILDAQDKQSLQNKKQILKIVSPKPVSSNNIQNKIVWDIFDFVFTFSLLTDNQKAPPTGDYIPDEKCHAFKDKLKFKSKLLYDILDRFSHVLRQIRSMCNDHGKFMMLPPDCVPVLKHVRRDDSFQPPSGRVDTVRSFIRISVPIFVPRDDLKAREAAKDVVRRTFADTIRTGKFDGF